MRKCKSNFIETKLGNEFFVKNFCNVIRFKYNDICFYLIVSCLCGSLSKKDKKPLVITRVIPFFAKIFLKN